MAKIKNEKDKEYLVSLTKKNELSPEELLELMQATVEGTFSYGAKRSDMLGDWYNVVQRMVNTEYLARRQAYYAVKQEMVFDYIGERAAIQQIAEESAELAKAALKYLRYLENANPVYLHGVRASLGDERDEQELIDSITEELSDVTVACSIARFAPDELIMVEKINRSLERLKGFNNGKDKEAGHSQACV